MSDKNINTIVNWKDLNLSQSDLDFIYNYLLEKERGKPSAYFQSFAQNNESNENENNSSNNQFNNYRANVNEFNNNNNKLGKKHQK